MPTTITGSDISTEEISGTLFVDSANNLVGIGTSSPNERLTVAGDAEINGLTVGRGGGDFPFNVALGVDALVDNTDGTDVTAVGQAALNSNTTGSQNTAAGNNALGNNTTGKENVAMGANTLVDNTTGIRNTAIGYLALPDSTTGENNIGVGWVAGRFDSPFTITNQSNRIVMGNNDHTDAYIKVSWTVTSDARDKTAFAPVPHGLDFITALEPTEYQFKVGGRESEEGDGRRRYGFLAQDVMALEGDNVVIADAEDPENLKLKESQIIPVLVNAVKELAVQAEDLKAEIKQLKEQ